MRPNAIPRTTMLSSVLSPRIVTTVTARTLLKLNIESLCWEGVDVDGEALGAGLFEGDGAAKVGAEERTKVHT